jgi:hypothetical protein
LEYVKELYEIGETPTNIARRMSISRSTVKGVGDPMLRGYFIIISEVFRVHII